MSILQRALLLVCLCGLGCPKSGSKEPDFGVAPVDFAKRGTMDDLAPPPNLFCPASCGSDVCCIVAASGGGSSASCVAPGACPDGGVFAACTKPSECSGGTPTCCAVISSTPPTGDGGTQLNYGSVTCQATCPAGLDTNTNTYQAKICATRNDCAGYQGTFPTNSGPMTVPFDGCCSSTRAPGIYYCIPSGSATGLTCL